MTMQKIIATALFASFSLAFGEGVIPQDKVGSTAGFTVYSQPVQEVGEVSKAYLDSVAEHLLDAAKNPIIETVAVPHDEYYPPQDRRKLSMSIQREAHIQEIFKRQEQYLKRDFNDIHVEDEYHPNKKAALPVVPPKAEKPLPITTGMVYIPNEFNPSGNEPRGFFVSAKPITNQEYLHFITATHYHTPAHWIGGKIPEGTENKPVVNISYRDALTYAIWAGKRLPTQHERTQAERTLRFYNTRTKKFNEWTSTSFYRNDLVANPLEPALDPQYLSKTHYKAVHSHSQGMSYMYREDHNNFTGFRLVLDAF